LPNGIANAPAAGIVTIVNTNSAGITLGNDATVFAFTINNNATLNLNGKNLRCAGVFNNASAVVNTGLNSSVAGSKLSFIGNIQQANYLRNQTFAGVVTTPDVDIYNTLAGTSGGAGFWDIGGSINNLTIFSGGNFYAYNGTGNLNIKGDILNNGIIYDDASQTGSIITLNGTALQTISGTGIWQMTGTNGGNGKYTGFAINNTSGLSPSINLNQNIALQNQLFLTSGVLSGTGTLTFGNAVGTLTCTRTNGSIDAGLNCAYNLGGVTYNLNYNTATAAQTTGKELPPATYTDYKLGTLTIANPTANGGVILNADSYINNLTTNASTLFNLNGKILNIYGTSFSHSGVIDASNANSTLSFIGISTQTLGGTMAANYTNNFISNLTVNNNAGLNYNSPIQIGSAAINGNLNLTNGNFYNYSQLFRKKYLFFIKFQDVCMWA